MLTVVVLWLSQLASCSVGHGVGEIKGDISIAGCRQGSYDLNPTVFFAESTEDLLILRLQRGSDLEVRSDGLTLLVQDASQVSEKLLGHNIAIVPDGEPLVGLTLYLNETCPADRDLTPVAIKAVSGTVRFTAIYAPEVDKDEVRIAAELTEVRFEDPRLEDRFAVLSGSFDFLYVRGSPAQRFP